MGITITGASAECKAGGWADPTFWRSILLVLKLKGSYGANVVTTATSVTVRIPTTSLSGKISVSTPGGTATSANSLVITAS